MTEDVRDLPMLVPRFVTRFSCLKGECPDTCCFGRDVNVSEDRMVFFHGLQSSMGAGGGQYSCPETQTLAQGGRVCTQGSGAACALLSSEGLCLLWQAAGENALPVVCYNYPRISHLLGARAEQTLSFSCPAAASRALMDDDAFVFEEAAVPLPAGTILEIEAATGFDHAIIDEARILALQLLTEDRVSNAECWVALGILCDQIDQCSSRLQPTQLAGALQEIVAFVESGEVQEVVGRISAAPAATGSVIALLLGDIVASARSPHQQRIMSRAMAGLGWVAGASTDVQAIGRRYAEILESLESDTSRMLDRCLRRFLLNESFQAAFPWGRQGPATQQLRELVVLYGCLRLLLVGAVASGAGGWGDKSMVATAQVFARIVMHTPSFLVRANQLLLASGGGHLAKLMQLVR
ncbi:MAG: flagellin lysine-N-methylase [Candidatus Accumulibacter sp.]|uniref:flagellin lysine-N-methylase n=1 Tax=Accumulibacter sp. TaxID=2053492 RepID=UPI0028793FA2|nr:flagellin lysine-N-methylase [Accumulibacter sp.]MDS4013416.1 flagellin lysine-N-methylase [Accumulibacter sp.]